MEGFQGDSNALKTLRRGGVGQVPAPRALMLGCLRVLWPKAAFDRFAAVGASFVRLPPELRDRRRRRNTLYRRREETARLLGNPAYGVFCCAISVADLTCEPKFPCRPIRAPRTACGARSGYRLFHAMPSRWTLLASASRHSARPIFRSTHRHRCA